jgi:hypothetical protein
MLPATALALHLIGLRRLQALLDRFSTPNEPNDFPIQDGDALREGKEIARIVNAAARHGPYRANCLPRSLVVWCLLRRRSIVCDLRIGVRKEDGRFEAHAWIEHKGAVVNDWGDVGQRFVSFDRAIEPIGLRA